MATTGSRTTKQDSDDASELPALILTRPGNSTDTFEHKKITNLEYSFDVSFAKARQYAYTCVVQRLDPLRPWGASNSSAWLSCEERIGKGHPIQEKLLRACQSYTSQWLSERDTSWWTERFPVVRLISLGECGSDSEEDDLVKAVGAWSLDMKSDYAQDALKISSKIDTIPGSEGGLVDAKSRIIPQKENGSTPRQGQMETADPSSTIEPHDNDNHDDDDDEENCYSSDASEVAYTPRQLNYLDEQVECLLPPLIHAIQLRRGHPGITAVPGSAYAPSQNSHSQNPHASPGGSRAGHNHHKRRRIQQDEYEDDDYDDNNDDNNSSDDGKPLRKSPKSTPLLDTAAKLACHFHKFDERKYSEGSGNGKFYKTCARGFKDSKELKDHHKKKHYGPKHLCSNCHVEFDSSSLKAAHEKERPACTRKDNPDLLRERFILIGTERRDKFDGMKKPRDTSHETYWFHVWDVLFAGKQRPATPYVPRAAFDAAFGKIAEEEIQRVVYSHNHESLTPNQDEALRLLRDLVQRLHDRLRRELRAGRLHLSEADLLGEHVNDQIEPATPRFNLLSNSTSIPTGHLMPPQTHVSPHRQRYPSNDTILPSHFHYSPSDWSNLPVSEGSSNGSQPSYNTTQSTSHSFTGGDNDARLGGQMPSNQFNINPTTGFYDLANTYPEYTDL